MNYGISTKSSRSKRASGVVECLYAIKDEIATLNTPPEDPVAPLDAVVISDAHVFTDETNGFKKFYMSREKTEAIWKSFGDKDSKGVDATIDGFFPGITPGISTFLYDDKELILLIPNGPCGTSEYLQLGDRCQGAEIMEFEAKTGKFGGGDAKGVQIKLNSKMNYITFYNAAIPMAV